MGSNARNVLVFAAMSPPQPWRCHFCDEDVDFTLGPQGRGGHAKSPTLHHEDGNHDNNNPANWCWCHSGCHTKHHTAGGTRGYAMTDDHRAAISRAQTGRVKTPEERAKIGAALAGRVNGPLSDEHKAAIGTGQTKRWQRPGQRLPCPGCDLLTTCGPLARHRKATGH